MKNLIFFILCPVLMVNCQENPQNDKATKREQAFSVQKTEAQYKDELSALQYRVLRQGGTEPRHSSPLIKVTENGDMRCAACGNLLFRNEHKYTTTSSWPSFDRAVEGAVTYAADYKLGYKRIEVLCAQCGSHLGHVFNDGPRETTGKRYCIDGAALKFVPDEKKNMKDE